MKKKANTQSVVTLNINNVKAYQIHDDYDQHTVANGMDEMKRELAGLVEKCMIAEDSEYIPFETANDKIEQITTANQELLLQLSDISKQVVKSIEKIKEDQNGRK